MIWLALAGLLILACWVYLAVLPLGTGFHGAVAGHQVDLRVIANSPLARLIRWLSGTPPERTNALTLFGRMHVAGGAGSPFLIAHEIGHHVRGSHRIGYVLRYICSPGFRRGEEAACDVFAQANHSTGFVAAIHRRLAQ